MASGLGERGGRRLAMVTTIVLVASIAPAAASPSSATSLRGVPGPITDGGSTTEVLSSPLRVSAAVGRIGVATLRRKNADLPSATFDRLLGDRTTWADRTGRLYVVDPLPPAAIGDTSTTDVSEPVWNAPYPLSSTFQLHTLPGASRVIYLDFDGGTVSNTAWNSSYNSGAPIVVAPFDLDASPGSFNDAERSYIQEVWVRVAEDYAPFNIDVTTADPGLAAIDRSGSADQEFGTRVMFTGSGPIEDACGCGGLAYIGTYDNSSSHADYQPAWVFALNNAKTAAEAAAHEVGHNVGLNHDGTSTLGYYEGHDPWAPIMGVGYSQPVVQFSNGAYSGADNTEDDFAIIQSNGAPLRPDDHGNTAVVATALPGPTFDVTGVIETAADVDVYSVTVPAGPLMAFAYAGPVAPNLDIELRVLDGSGTEIANAHPTVSRVDASTAKGLSASVNLNVAAGTYTLWVSGVGAGSPPASGYPDYGSVGRYRLSSQGPTLTVAKTGTGSGTVTSVAAGISCGSTCSAVVDLDAEVTLTAAPAPGSILDGWQGVSCYTEECTVSVTSSRTVAAVFSPIPVLELNVALAGSGSGSVTSTPAGISCGVDCSAQFEQYTMVELDATPSPGSVFVGWSGGGCSGDSPTCYVSMSAPRSVTATFSPQRSLTVTVAGEVGGSVTTSPGFNYCYDSCSYDFADGTPVSLAPVSNDVVAFSGWSGACTGMAVPCELLMAQSRSVTANFVLGQILTLTLDGQDGDPEIGRVTADQAGKTCEYPSCWLTFIPGSTVTLTAQVGAKGTFSGWSGACGGQEITCVVTMSEAREVTATFALLDVQSVDISFTGSGTGTVTSVAAGVSCTDSCSKWIDTGTTLTLVATPSPGSTFAGWSNDCSGTGNCVLSMTEPRSVWAQFDTPVYSLSVSRSGAGDGDVTSDPGTISCGSSCLDFFDGGTQVTLTATPTVGSEFTGWTGACTGTGACIVTMSQDRSVVATFGLLTFAVTVTKSGGGQGVVTSSPLGISCGATCSHAFATGTAVSLTALAVAGSTFAGWSDDCTAVNGATCSVTVSAARNVTATFTTTLPAAPGGPGATPANKSAVLSWAAPSTPPEAPILDYVIQRSKAGGKWTTLSDGKKTTTTYTVKSLSNGTSYAFRIAAKNKYGQGPWMQTTTVVPRTVPGTPRSLVAKPGAGWAVLTWKAPSSNGGSAVSDYRVEVSVNGTTWTIVADGVSLLTTYTVTGLTNGTKYRLRVSAINVAGVGKPTASRTVTPKV